MAYAAETESGKIFQNRKTAVTLHITLNELGFIQPLTPIKMDKYDNESIVNSTGRKNIQVN